MSLENRRLVEKACQHLSNGDVDELYTLFHPDGTWWIPYREDRFAYAGRRNNAEMSDMLKTFIGGFDSFRFDIQKIVSEDDTVAVEATSDGKGPGTAIYTNRYLLFFTIKDGTIFSVREHFDPYQVEVYAEQAAANA